MGFKKRFMDQLTKPMANAMKLQAQAFGEIQRAQSAAADGGPDPAESPPAEPPGESDPSEATQEDWLRLARFCQSTVAKLQIAFPEINPRNCIVRVYRTMAKPFRGSSRIPPGIIPDLTFEWPFNLADIEQQVAEECGGGAYELRVYDGSTRVASVPLTLGIPPKAFRDESGGSENEPDKLTRIRNKIVEEELNKTLLEKQGERQAVERQVEAATPRQRPAANLDDGGEPPPRTYMLEPAAEPQPDIESEVEARVAKRLGDFELRQQLKDFARATDEKINKLTEMVGRTASGDNGGGSQAVLIETIRGAFTAMQAAFGSNQNPTAGLQTELMKMQMENQRSNMEFLLRMMELKGAGGGMGANETLEAIRTGIELAAERGGGEQEGDWLQTGVKALTNLVAGEALKKADQSGQQVDPAVVQAQAEIIAKQTVAKMMAEAQARRAAAAAAQVQPGVPASAQQPPPAVPPAGGVMRRRVVRRPAPPAAVPGSDDVIVLPPEQPEQAMPSSPSVPAQGTPQPPAAAPAAVPQPPATATDEEKKVIVGRLLAVVAKEVDDRPYKSNILALARAHLPLDLQTELLNADESVAEGILLRYANGVTLTALGMKIATNPHIKAWVKQQVQFIRADLAAYRAAVMAQQQRGA